MDDKFMVRDLALIGFSILWVLIASFTAAYLNIKKGWHDTAAFFFSGWACGVVWAILWMIIFRGK